MLVPAPPACRAIIELALIQIRGCFLPPPLLCIHLWCLKTSTVVVYRGCSLHFSCHRYCVHICDTENFSSSNLPSPRCNPPSHSKRNQPLAQQQLSTFTAGAISLQHSRRFNYPSTQHEQLPFDQQAQPVLAKQVRPDITRAQ